MWVARERSPGNKLLFTPYSNAPGAVMTPTDSPIHTLADLDCRSLGVAGGPLDTELAARTPSGYMCVSRSAVATSKICPRSVGWMSHTRRRGVGC